MNKNVGILFSDFGPYHIARINALGDGVKELGIGELIAFRFSEKSSTYAWKPLMPENIKVITLAEKKPSNFASSLKMAQQFAKYLKKHEIEFMFLPAYSPLPNLLCLLACKTSGCKAIMMNESWHKTEKSKALGKLAKHLLVRLFDAGLVGGTPQAEYAISYGLKKENVSLGYDIVDNVYYSAQSAYWKAQATEDLPIKNLPRRFFLNLGRFVYKKNLTLLIKAYATLIKKHPETDIALVLVGSGEEETQLKQLAAAKGLLYNGQSGLSTFDSKPHVVFYPFQQSDVTPIFFAKCEAFILPSLYEEWGLVVNEAMASGTAVLVSSNVGCAQDLVVESVNGFTFNPSDENDLVDKLEMFVNDSELSKKLGDAGATQIEAWGPGKFKNGAKKAIESITKHLS